MGLGIRLAAAVAAAVFATSAFAAKNGATVQSEPDESRIAGKAVTTGNNLELIKTVIRKDNATPVSLPAPQKILDPLYRFNCPAPGSCVVEAEVTVQVASTFADNRIRLCTLLDGTAMAKPPSTCLTAGLIPQTTDVEFGKFIVVTMPSAVFAVPAGNHTLRSLAQTDQDATLGYTYIKYSIYKTQ